MKFQYHFEPHKGWMNDPNGLCCYKGQYHAFFQYNPYAPVWDSMHWGHAVSENLVTWKQVETALIPEEAYENAGGCFSGSAIEKEDMLYLFYTAVSKEYGQAQATASSSDGIHFVKNADNPIIPFLPGHKAGETNQDFRDPKVFEAFGRYYMVCGSCQGQEGQILLYSSEDLEHWRFENILYRNSEFGGTLECPDLFRLADKWVLMFSAMKPTAASTVFVIGQFDGTNFHVERTVYSEYGIDFYAPQTFSDFNNRRIMIGWFYHWNKPLPQGAEAAGALSIPRELALADGVESNYPVKEARHLLVKECKYVKTNGTLLTICDFDGNTIYEKDFYDVNGIKSFESVEILFDQKAVEVFINKGAVSVSQWLI